MLERELTRYSAYFRGWCQAFGEHEHISGDESGIDWLLAEHQAGLVLPKPLIKQLYRDVILHHQAPTLTFSRENARIGSLRIALAGKQDRTAMAAIKNMLENGDDFHVYLTSHLLYGSGARIFTFSNRKPLAIIYKEIGRMRVRLE
jgi:hypothetical protein